MSTYKTFKFIAETIDGVIQEFPKEFYLRCEQVIPIGASQVRNYNGTECIQVMNVFLVQYNGQLLGNTCIKDKSQFVQFFNARCRWDYILLNGCNLQLNGCDLIL